MPLRPSAPSAVECLPGFRREVQLGEFTEELDGLLVAGLGGRVKIRIAKGKGSTFRIVVPDGREGTVEGKNIRTAEAPKGKTDEVRTFLRHPG